MKKVLIVGWCVSCMMLAGAIGVLAGDSDEFYMSGNVGINFDTGTDVKDIEFDEGYQVGIAVGNRIQEHVRIEAEYQYIDTDNKLEVDSLMTNIYYDVYNWGGFTPYISTGIGIGWFDYEDSSYASMDDHSFIWKLGAGVDYNITDNVQLGLRYTYIDAVDDIEWDTNQVGTVATYKF